MQQLVQADPCEHLADVPAGMLDAEHAARSRRGVVNPDQFADAGGVDVWHVGKVEQNLALAPAEQRTYLRSQSAIDWSAKRAFEMDNRLSPGHVQAPSLNVESQPCQRNSVATSRAAGR